METISGSVARVFHSGASWSAVQFKTKSGMKITAAGAIPSASVGAPLELTGEWREDPKYGRQFSVVSSTSRELTSKDDIIAYLSSGFIKGVGPAIAKKIYKQFKSKSLEVIEDKPESLTLISGISERIAKEIHESHVENKAMIELINMLRPEITEYQIERIYDKYGKNSVQILKDDPYQLIKALDGVGFKKADMIAKAAGMADDDPRRINACILHVLNEEAYGGGGGHCYLPVEKLELSIRELIGEVDNDIVAGEIIKNRDDGDLVIDGNDIYLDSLYKAETQAADHIKRLLMANPDSVVSEHNIRLGIKQIEDSSGYALEEKQKAAVGSALNNGLSVITGGPGTGKTTIVRTILTVWRIHVNQPGFRGRDESMLLAPTGKAAKRMEEVTSKQASTIHRGLKFSFNNGRMSFAYDHMNPLDAGLVIVDETSMLDINMGLVLLRAVASGSRVVLIGDIDQLPPIGPGNFFRDIVNSPKVPVVQLDVSHRQSGAIAINANRINTGTGPHGYVCDETFKWIPCTKEDIREKSIAEYMALVEEFGPANVAYLGPMKTRSTTGVEGVNKDIRDRLNPIEDGTPVFEVSPQRNFRVGDRVMQIENDYKKEVFNGDMGFVKSIDEDGITVRFDDDHEVEYTKREAGKLILSYAMTVHKSQGSEYKATVVVCNSEHFIMAYRNLIYTAVSRAQQKQVICGDAKTLALAANTIKPIVRNTKLKERLLR